MAESQAEQQLQHLQQQQPDQNSLMDQATLIDQAALLLQQQHHQQHQHHQHHHQHSDVALAAPAAPTTTTSTPTTTTTAGGKRKRGGSQTAADERRTKTRSAAAAPVAAGTSAGIVSPTMTMTNIHTAHPAMPIQDQDAGPAPAPGPGPDPAGYEAAIIETAQAAMANSIGAVPDLSPLQQATAADHLHHQVQQLGHHPHHQLDHQQLDHQQSQQSQQPQHPHQQQQHVHQHAHAHLHHHHPEAADPANASSTAAAALGSMYPTLHIPTSTEEQFAAQAAQAAAEAGHQQESAYPPPPADGAHSANLMDGAAAVVNYGTTNNNNGNNNGVPNLAGSGSPTNPSGKPSVGSAEWHKQRKDNHKEVERRRRETINEGINELSKIVPGCEKNKGSILQRAVAFITQLKDNENQNIEKWTLEKLLTEQALNELSTANDKLKRECERVYKELETWKQIAQGAGLQPPSLKDDPGAAATAGGAPASAIPGSD